MAAAMVGAMAVAVFMAAVMGAGVAAIVDGESRNTVAGKCLVRFVA
jgi:hypothetical protein